MEFQIVCFVRGNTRSGSITILLLNSEQLSSPIFLRHIYQSTYIPMAGIIIMNSIS